jgi:hypothetical protein
MERSEIRGWADNLDELAGEGRRGIDSDFAVRSYGTSFG